MVMVLRILTIVLLACLVLASCGRGSLGDDQMVMIARVLHATVGHEARFCRGFKGLLVLV